MSDRVAVFDDGRIQQIAPPDQLYEEPENSFVAQFIGETTRLKARSRKSTVTALLSSLTMAK